MNNTPGEPIRLTRAQVREIDRRATEEYHIPGIVLMENAARAVTDAAVEMLGGVLDAKVLIVCGGGNNGGDGLAVARHLHNRGVRVSIALATDTPLRGDAETNLRIVQAMRIPSTTIADADAALARGEADLVIDALFGTGLSAAPRDTQPLDVMNSHGVPVLSIDLPSGLDCDTGQPLTAACVRAARTVTFVAEKVGFANPLARQYLGRVTVGDIGCPRALIESVARGSGAA